MVKKLSFEGGQKRWSAYYLMFLMAVWLWLYICPRSSYGYPCWECFSDEAIVEAIGLAENSVRYPYGVKSINTNGNAGYARQICLNSVKNGRLRWVKAGKPYDLIYFIGLRYCPNEHKVWVKNVKYFLSQNRQKGL